MHFSLSSRCLPQPLLPQNRDSRDWTLRGSLRVPSRDIFKHCPAAYPHSKTTSHSQCRSVPPSQLWMQTTQRQGWVLCGGPLLRPQATPLYRWSHCWRSWRGDVSPNCPGRHAPHQEGLAGWPPPVSSDRHCPSVALILGAVPLTAEKCSDSG